jgi:hypothetical protein
MTSCAEQILSTFLSQLACLHTAQLPEPLTPSAQSLRHILTSFITSCCQIPSLSLSDPSTPEPTDFGISLETASKRLSTPLKLKSTDLSTVPVILLHNVSSSFQSLLDRRLRVTLEVLKQKCSNKEWASDICAFLEKHKCPLALSAASSSFHPIPHRSKSKDKALTFPFIYEAVFQVTILNQSQFSVIITTPGLAVGFYEDSLFTDVQVTLETDVLFLEMKQKCKDVILDAILHVKSQFNRGVTNHVGERSETSSNHSQDDCKGHLETKKRLMYSPENQSKTKRNRSSTPLTGINGLLAAAISIQ